MMALIPLYLVGNLHCFGMCGPLAFLIAKHRYRWLYFCGRLCSFSFVGLISGEIGWLITASLQRCHLGALFSLAIGVGIIAFAFTSFFPFALPGKQMRAHIAGTFNTAFARKLSHPSPWPVFLLGVGTVLLPCGQTLVVFSAIALSESASLGCIHGLLFALLTSPSLIAAMYASTLFQKGKKQARLWMGMAAALVGTLAILRALADWQLIPHLAKTHLVIY